MFCFLFPINHFDALPAGRHDMKDGWDTQTGKRVFRDVRQMTGSALAGMGWPLFYGCEQENFY
jgi:uncharacterized membrane protein YedE/YeeE